MVAQETGVVQIFPGIAAEDVAAPSAHVVGSESHPGSHPSLKTFRHKKTPRGVFSSGGEGGIRTLDTG